MIKNTDRVAIGLIGCGKVVESLHLPALASIPGVRVKWVCDTSLERAKLIAKSWSIPRALDRVEECTEVDAVLVASPVGTRSTLLTTIFQRSWHAFCEKPFAIDATEHHTILDAAAREGLVAGAAFQRRHYWAVQKVRNLLSSQCLGPLIEVSANESALLERTGIDMSSYRNNMSASGGGVLMESGCHLIDEVLFMCGAADSVIDDCTQRRIEGYEVETIASGRIRLSTAASVAVKISVSGISPLFPGIWFRCADAEIRLFSDPGRPLELYLGGKKANRLELPHPNPASHLKLLLRAFRAEWMHFLEGVRNPEKWDLAQETGFLTSETITRCIEAAGETVVERA